MLAGSFRLCNGEGIAPFVQLRGAAVVYAVPMISRCLPLFAVLLAGSPAVTSLPARAQAPADPVPLAPAAVPVVSGGPTVVYQLTFHPDENSSLNFQPYDTGYYVAPVEGGSGSLLVTRTTGGSRQYYYFANFGQLFVARDGGDRKAVITCTAASTTSTTAFFAIGDASQVLSTDTGELKGSAYYAEEMSGYSLTADSNLGAAGSSRMEAVLHESFTDEAQLNHWSVSQEIGQIAAWLNSQKYTFTSPTNAATTGTTGSSVGTSDPSKGPGDLLVYRLSFSKTGESINFKPFSGGYYIASASKGQSSLIIEANVKGAGKLYKAYSNFGTLFATTSDTSRKGVLAAMDATSVSSTTYFAIGDLNDSFKVDTPSFKGSVNYAKKLKGYAISADSGFDLAFLGEDADVGVGGAASLTASYLEETSKLANKNLRTVADEVLQLEKELKADGFTKDTSKSDQ